jgi:hypothetical protein
MRTIIFQAKYFGVAEHQAEQIHFILYLPDTTADRAFQIGELRHLNPFCRISSSNQKSAPSVNPQPGHVIPSPSFVH